MKRLFKTLFVLPGLTVVAGCASRPFDVDPASRGITPAGDTRAHLPAESAVSPYGVLNAPLRELDSEVVFNTLVGEIAMQRGDLDLAFRHQLQAAVLSGDAEAAKRATQIAITQKKPELALKAVETWVELDPNDLTARQLAAKLLFENGSRDQVLEHMEAIVAIGRMRGDDGFMQVVAAFRQVEDTGAAVELVSRLAAAHEDDRRAGFALATLAMMSKDFDLAEIEILRIIERYPDWNQARILLSRLYVARGDLAAASTNLEQAIAAEPEDVSLNSALAQLYLRSENYPSAYQQFLKVERLLPENTDVLFSLGVLALQLGDTAHAREHFGQLQRLGKRPVESAYYLGRIDEMDGRLSEAVEWFEQVDSGQLHYEAQIRIAQIRVKQGSLDQAREGLQKFRTERADRSVQLFLVEAGLMQEHASPELVLELYDRALQAHPDDDDLLYSRGLYAVTIDRLDILERDLRVIIENSPDHADALNALGYTLADRTERYQEALGLISRALTLKPDTPAILDSMGWVQYRLGNYQQALTYLGRAYGLLQDPEIAAHLAEVLWVTGDREQARKVWLEMLDKEPDSKPIRESMQRLTR